MYVRVKHAYLVFLYKQDIRTVKGSGKWMKIL